MMQTAFGSRTQTPGKREPLNEAAMNAVDELLREGLVSDDLISRQRLYDVLAAHMVAQVHCVDLGDHDNRVKDQHEAAHCKDVGAHDARPEVVNLVDLERALKMAFEGVLEDHGLAP